MRRMWTWSDLGGDGLFPGCNRYNRQGRRYVELFRSAKPTSPENEKLQQPRFDPEMPDCYPRRFSEFGQ